MTVVDCTAPLNRYTCYGAIEVVAIIIIIIIIIYGHETYTETQERQ